MTTHDAVVSDALIAQSDAAGLRAKLEAEYGAGAVPVTYKMFYYEATHSIADAEWPSPAWVARKDPYFDLTLAPEQLPAMTE